MEDGGFTSEVEVIDTALRLLEAQSEQGRLADLRRGIAIGIEEVDRGESAPFDPHATLERIRARHVIQEGQTDPRRTGTIPSLLHECPEAGRR